MADSYGNGAFRGVGKKRADLSSLHSNNVRSQKLSISETSNLNDVVIDSTLDVNGLTSLNGGVVTGSGGSSVYEISSGTVSANPGSIGADSKGSVNVTITNLKTTDRIVLESPSSLNAGLLYVGHRITADNTLTIYLYNATGGSIDDGANTWSYLWFDLTN